MEAQSISKRRQGQAPARGADVINKAFATRPLQQERPTSTDAGRNSPNPCRTLSRFAQAHNVAVS
jgi:hypothetical protein